MTYLLAACFCYAGIPFAKSASYFFCDHPRVTLATVPTVPAPFPPSSWITSAISYPSPSLFRTPGTQKSPYFSSLLFFPRFPMSVIQWPHPGFDLFFRPEIEFRPEKGKKRRRKRKLQKKPHKIADCTFTFFLLQAHVCGKHWDLPMSNIPPRGATVSDGPSLWKKKRRPPFAVAAIPKPEPSPLRSVWHYADVFPFPFSLSLFGLGGGEGTGDDDKSALSLNSGLGRNGARGLVEWEKSQFSYAAVTPSPQAAMAPINHPNFFRLYHPPTSCGRYS